jgi:Domain of unknown function (DUF222)/HNH endonuclease
MSSNAERVFGSFVVMSTLRSALDGMTSEDVAALSDAELVDDLEEIERAVRVLEAHRASVVAEVERRQAYAADGSLSTTAWLVSRIAASASDAARHVRLARSLPHMPSTRDALAQGEISTTAAVMLAIARETDVAAFARCEESLVDAARALPVGALRRAVEHWRQLTDGEAGQRAAERRFERRGLFVSTTMDGMVRVDGDLDPETGQTVLTALRSIVDADARDSSDDRRPAQRRADALGEICRRHLDSGDRGVVAGERPHLVVTVDVARLGSRGGVARPGGVARLDDAGVLPAEAVRRLSCDANVIRIVTRGASEPLDVGRRTPVVPAALRRALVVRDGGCRFPGCDRPPGWTDAHHVVHWADGGPTALRNLVLLCRRHHRLVHDGFSVAMDDGRPVFTRPDGNPIRDPAAP